jgi:hypothetical protein
MSATVPIATRKSVARRLKPSITMGLRILMNSVFPHGFRNEIPIEELRLSIARPDHARPCKCP